MRAKQCPHCHQKISHSLLKSSKRHKAYIKREVFACPHCEEPVQLPPKAEKILSAGLLFSVIFAPLPYYWFAAQNISYLLFGIGVIFVFIGISTNKLIIAGHKTVEDTTRATIEKMTKEAKTEGDHNE